MRMLRNMFTANNEVNAIAPVTRQYGFSYVK